MLEEKKINIKVNKALWKEVSVYSSENEDMKKSILNQALREFLDKRKGKTNE